MNRTHALWLVVALAACSDPIAVLSTSTSSASGAGGSASSSSSASGSGGVGGAGGAGGGVVVSASSASSTGTGTISKCLDPYLDVAGDGAPQHYTALCAISFVEGNPPGPVAYTPMGGGIISSLRIEGCATSSFGSAGLTLNISNVNVPGTDTLATATYDDASATAWGSMGAGTVAVTIDVYEDIGGVVEGSYTAAVQSQSATKMLSGTFRVCHVWEIPKP
jgi:hypothetical protein